MCEVWGGEGRGREGREGGREEGKREEGDGSPNSLSMFFIVVYFHVF